MYARESQIGEFMKCPDCFSQVKVKAPYVAPYSPKKPTLEGAEEFNLSDPGERPAYRPFVDPRGEYEELLHLDPLAPVRKPTEAPAPATPEVTPPDQDPLFVDQPFPKATVMPSPTEHLPVGRPTAVTSYEEDLDDQEIVLRAPVDRPEYKPEIPHLSPPPPTERREEPREASAWDDSAWGYPADPNQPNAWKQSPFLLGIVGFLFYPSTLFRLVVYSVGLSVVLWLGFSAVELGQQGGVSAIFGIFCTLLGGLAAISWTGSFSACLYAVTQDTGNGMDKVEAWPDWSVTEWLGQALYVPAASFLACIPGSIFGSLLLTAGDGAELMLPFPVLMSQLLFFPPIFGSMMAEGSLLAPYSPAIVKSFKTHGDGWLLFYIASFFIGVIQAVAIGLLELEIGLIAPLSAVILVTSIFLYFRLLGRLIWYGQNVRPQR